MGWCLISGLGTRLGIPRWLDRVAIDKPAVASDRLLGKAGVLDGKKSGDATERRAEDNPVGVDLGPNKQRYGRHTDAGGELVRDGISSQRNRRSKQQAGAGKNHRLQGRFEPWMLRFPSGHHQQRNYEERRGHHREPPGDRTRHSSGEISDADNVEPDRPRGAARNNHGLGKLTVGEYVALFDEFVMYHWERCQTGK